MKIALVQQSASEDREDNRQRGLEAVRNAAGQGAEVVCFAELGFDRFWPQVPATEERRGFAEPIPGPTTDAFSALAKELGVVLVAVDPDPAPAQLSDRALQRLQDLEQQTGKLLLAYSQ